MGLAKQSYKELLNLNYDESWRGVPYYLRVAKVKLMLKRLSHPLREDYTYDYEVWFNDGTFDRVSKWECPPCDMPRPNQYCPRHTADYVEAGSYCPPPRAKKVIPGFRF